MNSVYIFSAFRQDNFPFHAAVFSSPPADGIDTDVKLLYHFCSCYISVFAKPFLHPFEVGGCAARNLGACSAHLWCCTARHSVSVSASVELSCGAFGGMGVKQPVERRQGFWACLLQQFDRFGQGNGIERQGSAAAHVQFNRDPAVVSGQRRVYDQQSEQVLSVRVFGFGSIPYSLKFLRRFLGALNLLIRDFRISCRGMRFAFSAYFFEDQQTVVPVDFQRCRYETVRRIHFEEPALRQTHFIMKRLDHSVTMQCSE